MIIQRRFLNFVLLLWQICGFVVRPNFEAQMAYRLLRMRNMVDEAEKIAKTHSVT